MTAAHCRRTPFVACCLLLALSDRPLSASVTAQAAREAAEYVVKTLGRGAAREGVEKLAVRIETAAAKYGDETVAAVKKVGPRAIAVADEAGENGAAAIRLAARHGDEGLILAQKPRSLALFAAHGDEAATAMIKHPAIAEPLIEAHGKEAAAALAKLSAQNGRRLETMREAGELARLGRTKELLATVAHYGDRGMDFVWKHKLPLATSAVLATFLADPGPYIDGAKDITKAGIDTVADAALRPIAELPRDVATEVAQSADWTPVLITLIGVVAALVALRIWLRRKVSREP